MKQLYTEMWNLDSNKFLEGNTNCRIKTCYKTAGEVSPNMVCTSIMNVDAHVVGLFERRKNFKFPGHTVGGKWLNSLSTTDINL